MTASWNSDKEALTMKHEIPADALGARTEPAAAAVGACVHCGFCLPTCPTYVELGEEMDSPRGRIFLIKQVLEGELELEAALPYVDNCLGCQACETACPSGVSYGELLTPFRAHAEELREREPLDRLRRALTLQTLPYPRRFRAAAIAGRLARPLTRLMPRSLRPMLELLPETLPPARRLPERIAARGTARARVALLTGCAQQVLDPEINAAAIRVLTRNGVEVVVPPGQGCCGALALHTGAAAQAQRLARRNLRAFAGSVDAIVTTAAGCGSGMKEYPLLFAGTDDEPDARAFADRVVDVAVFLAQLGLSEAPPPLPEPMRVAYHDACHLAHAQQVRDEPRELLSAVAGLELVTPDGWELCCGSAGTYNIERPEIARSLGARKAATIEATGARMVAAGNIGCLTQLQIHLRERGDDIPVLHTIQVLDRAYTGQLTGVTPA
jgi:glycolate oxidase iron-sulfur subunit